MATQLKIGKLRAPAHHSVRAILTASFLAVSLLVLLIATAITFYFNFETAQQAIRSDQQLIGQNAASTVTNFIQDNFKSLSDAANLNSLLNRGSSEQQLILSKLLGSNPAFREVSLLGQDNVNHIYVSRLPGATKSSVPNETAISILEETSKNKTYISPIFIDPATSEPLVIIATPATDILRDIKGAMVAELNLKFMWDLVASIKVGETGTAYVVDNQGNIIAFSDSSKVLRRENARSSKTVASFIAGGNTSGSTKTDRTTGINGTSVISSFVPLHSPNWAVILELPRSEAYKTITQNIKIALFVILESLILAILTGGYLARRIVKPIINLRDATNKISAGQFSTRIAVTRNDEIGDLSASFNTLAEQLEKFQTEMERKIADRTLELELAKNSQQFNIAQLEKNKIAMLNIMDDLNVAKKQVEQQVLERTAELKSEKEKLSESNALLKTLLENLPIGVFLAEAPSGKPIVTNKKMVEIFGQQLTEKNPAGDYTKNYSLVRDDGSIYPESDLPVNIVLKDKVVANKKDIILIRKDGTKRNIASAAAPIFNKEGELIEVVVVFEDITEASAVDKAKTEFVSLVSHQLRTPLSASNWYLELLQDGDAGPLTDEQKEYLGELEGSTKRMVDLVNTLLNVSRIELGAFPVTPELTDVTTIAKEIIHEMEVRLKDKQITVKESYQKGLPAIPIDRKLMDVALENLLSNAVKYTLPKGKIKVSIAQKEQSIVFTVTDSGYGIPLDQQQKIFSKMFRADNAKTKEPDGNGLGLYMVKTIIEQAGGAVWFESVENKGSSFYISIPITGMVKKSGTKLLNRMIS